MSDASTAAAHQSTRVARLLGLVRQLIDYGRQFATALRSNPAPSGASDVAAIVARIMHGLLRAEALEARIVRNAVRLDAERKPRPAASRRTSRAGLPEPNVAQTEEDQPHPTDQSAPEQIADLIKHQPIGAVIADICRDLGIRPNHPLWPELRQTILEHGGSLTRLIIDISRDRPFWRPVLSWLIAPAWPAPPQQSPALACTGPPA